MCVFFLPSLQNKRMPDGGHFVEGSELTFTSVSRHEAGTYECTADNGYGMQVSQARTRMGWIADRPSNRALDHKKKFQFVNVFFIRLALK